MSESLQKRPFATHVCILCWKAAGPSEIRAKKIAEFLGADVTFLSAASACDASSIRKLVPDGAALIARAEILARMVKATGADVQSVASLAPCLFVYGFTAAAEDAALIRSLSSRSFLGVEAPPAAETAFRVADDQAEWCGQFAGLPVRGVDPANDSVFRQGNPEEGAALIRVGTQPFFVRVKQGESQVFLAASSELADLDQEVNSESGVLPWFSRLVPLMMFLKRSLGDRAWHSVSSQACFIIDDPLLKPRYGFLKYTALLEAIRGQKFSSSIAFIPWNYRRSNKKIANLFLAERSRLSICVHGCDHTKAEFASTGLDLLRGKARLGLDRMQLHTERSGVPFDDVMVFPQGLFSVEAIKALAASGYVAAVNTDVCPSNKRQVLALRNLMDVAVTEFADLPLFGRHYPIDLAEFALDLFLGKPALAVAHHGYFGEGYQALSTFVKRLNDLDGGLEWNNLATICTSASLRKATAQGDIHVRFYTNRFRLTNNEATARGYVLFPHRTAGNSAKSFTVNGRLHEQEGKGDHVTITLEPGQSAEIRINSGSDATAPPPWKPTAIHSAGVLVRRLLCEFRDNYFETNRFLNSLLIRLRGLRTKEKQPGRLLRLPELKADAKPAEELCR